MYFRKKAKRLLKRFHAECDRFRYFWDSRKGDEFCLLQGWIGNDFGGAFPESQEECKVDRMFRLPLPSLIEKEEPKDVPSTSHKIVRFESASVDVFQRKKVHTGSTHDLYL
mmetsp:Transcript_7960/g.10624  ORF Transcript_7960/g.10624 Transcript_7960/m.10624 type:complete len:111 (-) Transcript_7960:1008-1340(-)